MERIMRIEDVIKIAKKVIDPIRRKTLLMIGHGIIEAAKDGGPLQAIQATFLADETKDDVRKMHHFGFSSNPPVGSECIAVSVGGNRESSVVIASEHRDFRFKNLAPGDCVFYNKNGKFIHLKGGNAEMLVSKIKIDNGSNELIAVLVEWMDEMIIAKNITGIGPQPLDPETITALTAVKTKLETFKV